MGFICLQGLLISFVVLFTAVSGNDSLQANNKRRTLWFPTAGFKRHFSVIAWCRAEWNVLETVIGVVNEPFQVVLLYSSCLGEDRIIVALDSLELIDAESGEFIMFFRALTYWSMDFLSHQTMFAAVVPSDDHFCPNRRKQLSSSLNWKPVDSSQLHMFENIVYKVFTEAQKGATEKFTLCWLVNC